MNQRIAHILEIAHSDDDAGLHKQGSELSLLPHTLCLAQAPPAQVIEHIVKICSLPDAAHIMHPVQPIFERWKSNTFLSISGALRFYQLL